MEETNNRIDELQAQVTNLTNLTTAQEIKQAASDLRLAQLTKEKAEKNATITIENITIPMELFQQTRLQSRKISLQEYNAHGNSIQSSVITVGETKISSTKKNLFKTTGEIKDAINLIGIILRQTDKATPVTEATKKEFEKYQIYLLDLINVDRPDRVIMAYESIVNRLFAFTLRNGERIPPTGWADAAIHITRVGEERSTWLFAPPQWDRFEITQNIDPEWIREARGERIESDREEDPIETCENWNGKRGCQFPGCKRAHRCSLCWKDGHTKGDGHNCVKRKKK